MKPFDYIGIIGKDPNALDPVAKTAWDDLRGAMVFGSHRWTPPSEYDHKHKLWRWQQIVTGFGGRRVLLDNLPKGLGKLEYDPTARWPDTAWQTAEKMGLHGYMGWPSIAGKRPKYRTISTPIQGASSELLEKIKRRNWEQATNPYANQVSPGGHVDDASISPTGRRLPMCFDPSMSLLSGGLRLGEFSGMYGSRLMNIDPLVIFKSRAGLNVAKDDYMFDFEANMHLEEKWEQIFKRIKPRSLEDATYVFDSIRPKCRVRLPPHAVWDEVHQYTYNPDHWLTKLYIKEREKKFDHKAAVSRVLKHNKFHDKKETARRLEFIGAGYEESKKTENKPKNGHTWGPGDLKQFSGRIKRDAYYD